MLQNRNLSELNTTGQLVFIGGAGRSGSTLLDLLLSNNPQIQSVGEIHRLNHYARTNQESCTCGENVMDCSFWLEVQKEAEKWYSGKSSQPLLKTLDMMIRPQDINRFLGYLQKLILVMGWPSLFCWFTETFCREHFEALNNSLFWYEIIRRVSGRSILVDSTKDARRLKALYMIDPSNFKLIYLIRDGRAVAASEMRRTGSDMMKAASSWKNANKASIWAQKGIPMGKIFKLKYEQLCTDPENSLRELCRFLEVEFDSQMLVLKKMESHNIGGNPMRFRKDEARVVLDERWRNQLSPRDIVEFDAVAGKLNGEFGYE